MLGQEADDLGRALLDGNILVKKTLQRPSLFLAEEQANADLGTGQEPG